LAYVSERGTLLEPDAMSYLLSREDPVGRLDRLLNTLPSTPLVVTLRDVMAAEEIARRAAVTPPIAGSFRRASELAADLAPEVTILRDITGRSTCEGTLEDFTRYFRHRFRVLAGFLRSRRELAGAQDLAKAKRSTREVRFIGIVSEVRTTRNGHRLLDLEDETDTVSVLLPGDSPLATEATVEDEVVGVVGTVNGRGLVIASAIVRPDLPVARPWPSGRTSGRVAFLSDIHIGSKTFLAERWRRLEDWIRDGDEVARSIRYLVVSGDVVDGIGVYPNQDEELEVDDIYAQYEALAGLFASFPDHVTVVMIPGNHDAVRPAEPQPALPASIQKLFDSNVVFAGNPALLQLGGVRVLAYHGRSMDDLVSSLPGSSYHRPLDLMKTMLRMRHLAPIYGGKTPIAPEAEDHLIVQDVPDIFVTGHVHSAGVDAYRGVVLVNASTWQAQTPYQKMRNIEPMPARLPIVDLATGEAVVRPF
jgi:DNA polymerase II small subunit